MSNLVFLWLLLFSYFHSWSMPEGSSGNSASYYKTLSVGVGIGFTAATVLWYAINGRVVKQDTKKLKKKSNCKKEVMDILEKQFEMETENSNLNERCMILITENNLLRHRLAQDQGENQSVQKPPKSPERKWYRKFF